MRRGTGKGDEDAPRPSRLPLSHCPAAQVTFACAWPVTSKHYTFELDLGPTTLLNWEHRAQETEAEIIGRFIDTFYERYRAAGLPEAIIDRDDNGRMKVKLMYEDPPSYHGTYTRAITRYRRGR